MKTIFSILAGLLFVAAFIPYIISILRGKTKPAKASWVIWVTLDTITFAGMLCAHSVNGQIIGVIIGGWTTVALALKYGGPGWTKLDKFCLSSAVVGIILWIVSNNPVLAIIVSVSVVFLGSMPTFVSAWKDPSKENKLAWTLFWLSCVAAVLAIPLWNMANCAQPIIFFIIESIMMILLYIKPLFWRIK